MAFKLLASSPLISEFNLRKYKNEKNGIVDGSEYLANVKEQVLSFYFEPTGETVYFKAFITTFNDTFTPSYSTTQVFGRTDPIQIYQNTTRQISLAFQVPAASEGEAFENLGRVQKIIHMLYPGYADLDNALTLTEAPLVRIKVMNLLSSQSSFKEARTNNSGEDMPDILASAGMGEFENYYFFYETTSAPDKGTLGVITSFTVNHNLENPQMGVFEKSANTVLPKVIDVNLSFTPFHEKTIGRTLGDPPGVFNPATGEVEVQGYNDPRKGFPYGVDLGDTSKNNLKPAGLSETRTAVVRRPAEAARRKANSAQQELDKVKAANKKALAALNEAGKLGKIDSTAFNQAKTSLVLNENDAYFDAAEAEREALAAEQIYEDFLKSF